MAGRRKSSSSAAQPMMPLDLPMSPDEKARAASKANIDKIAEISARFAGGKDLQREGRLLVMEGMVKKVSRKKQEPKQLFLMGDILVYGTPVGKDRYKSQNILELKGCAVQDVEDSADGSNGFTISSQKKSFIVYAGTRAEKTEWMSNLQRFIELSRTAAGISGPVSTRAVWVSDKKVKTCMMPGCPKEYATFSFLNRRHHCRNCGIVVCGKCSNVKAILNKGYPERVCTMCHRKLGGIHPSDIPELGAASTDTGKEATGAADSDDSSDDDDDDEPETLVAGSSAAAMSAMSGGPTVPTEAADLTSTERQMHQMSDSERMEIMMMVKDGKMTMDEAMTSFQKKKAPAAAVAASGGNPFAAPSAAGAPTGPYALALYANDDPEGDDELVFAEDDFIVLTNRVNEEWLEGYIHGTDVSKKGIFPMAFVEIKVDL